MDDLLLEPLKYYTEKGKRLHHENANKYFDALVERSGIDVDANRKVCADYREQLDTISKLDSRISKFKTFRVLLIIGCVIMGIVGMAGLAAEAVWLLPVGIAAIVGFIFLIVKKINPPIRDSSALKQAEEAKAKELGGSMIQLQAVNDEMHNQFYGNLGYQDCKNLVLKSKWL